MKKRTVLVVDDQLLSRRMLRKMLESDYNIIEACNGVEALEVMQKETENISAVILDIVMPVMDGHAVLKEISKDATLSKIPIIVSSLKENDGDEVLALSLGAQDYIPKPYKKDIILHRLSNTIKLRETAAAINKMEKDELTGFYNKSSFIEKVEQLILHNSDKKYDMLCFGIEGNELISTTYGEKIVNELIKYCADCVRDISENIQICSHFESGKYFALCSHKDKYDENTFVRLENNINEFPIEMKINIYCGIYCITDETVPINSVCTYAKLAAEKNISIFGEHFSYYDETIHQKLQDEQFITSNMTTALEENQFVVFYQPKYDLSDETIAGAEALVRWQHPERGMMPPGEFIPLFEHNGFITKVDHYVWETVCRDIRKLIDNGKKPVQVSVNVSRADIYNPNLPDIIFSLVKKYDIPIKYLHLEITESAYTTNPEQIIETVGKLRRLGFTIEMDDFGSGYSSLNMLAEMPVDIIKMDMRFVQHETAQASGKGIINFIISLAKWLDLAVIAEGVETSEQIDLLRSMDCNYVQGYYYAKPMPKTEFETLISSSEIKEMNSSSNTIHSKAVTDASWQATSSDSEILIVDDIEINRAVLSGAFSEKYGIVEKENGLEAWNYLDKNHKKVEAVLLDLLMPVMDGFQLLYKIRSDERMKTMPVIITSQGDSNSEHRALNMQADEFIAKPYNVDIIQHRVCNVIASHRLKEILDEKTVCEK